MPAVAPPFHHWRCFSSRKPAANSGNHLAGKPKIPLHKHPLYEQANAGISLCLEIMGVDSGRALFQNSALHAAHLDSIRSIVSFLQARGVHFKDLGRILGMWPRILTSDVKSDLDPVFNFLSAELGVPDRNFRRVINKCPRLLISSVRDQLKPALAYLRELGFKDFNALAYRDSILLVSNVEKTLIPKLDYLTSLGISKADAVGMVALYCSHSASRTI